PKKFFSEFFDCTFLDNSTFFFDISVAFIPTFIIEPKKKPLARLFLLSHNYNSDAFPVIISIHTYCPKYIAV
ncbi:MAG: hypothetical protein ACI3XQ_05325, partial [Eubacteriales bacterium]